MRYADEAGMELSRRNATLRISFYEADILEGWESSEPMDTVTVKGLREAVLEAKEWLTLDDHRNVTTSKADGQDFLDGKVPDMVIYGRNVDTNVAELIAVIEPA